MTAIGRGAILGGGGGSGGGSGTVTSVTAGDTTITVAGTATDPTVATTQSATFAWTGVHTWTNAATPVKSTITDGAAAAQLEGMRVAHMTSATATAGIGSYLSLTAENGAGTERECARLVGVLRTVTDAGENGTLLFQNMVTGTVANAGHFQSTSFFAANALGIGTVNATGVTTTLFQLTTQSSMFQYNNNTSTNGGHAFTGIANPSGARQFFTITPSANTASTASTEINKFAYNTYTNTWATGALTTQREFCIFAPTYAFAAASTITTAATVYIDGPPLAGSNATITTGHPLWIDAGTPRIDSTTANATTATVLGSVGPASANTTVQEWLTININGTVRFIPCF